MLRKSGLLAVRVPWNARRNLRPREGLLGRGNIAMRKSLLTLAGAVTASLMLSACAEDMGYGYFGGGGMAYYDDYYGPYYNGYWAPDGGFYYSTGRGRPYIRDEGRHFRRDHPGGYHGVRTHPGWAGRHHDRNHDRYHPDS
jgi:hypothetical protein